MPENESVSTSLIAWTDLPSHGLCAVDAIIDGENESIIVYRDGDHLAAWHNICPHAGRRLDYAPGKFLLDQGRLVCAAHGACFRLSDGECVAGPCRGEHLRAVAIVRRGEHVFLDETAAPP